MSVLELLRPNYLILALFVILFFKRGLLDAIIEGFKNFRGGPPTPMHPSPAGDVALLRKHSKKVEN